jgi:ubiquinone/menaquinone biosynthesis C-methylase UbiE
MPWLKRSAPTDSLAVSMSGAKLGDRLLVVGCSDPALIASLGSKAGLTGRACAVDAVPERVAEAARITEREGTLVETATAPGWTLPFDPDSFDLVVVRDVPPDDRTAAVPEARRVLRPGGRCMIIDTTARSGLGALLARRSNEGPYGDPESARRALEDAGFVAPRLLAERDGLLFVEGVKRNA